MENNQPTQSIQNAAQKRALSPAAIWLILLTPLAISLLLTVFSLPVFTNLHPHLWGENKLVELIQFPACFFAGSLGLTLAWRTRVQMEKAWITVFYTLFGLGMIFIAGEEIAWGQQFLRFRTPEFIRSFNVQNELTLHNVGPLQDRTDYLNLIFGLSGLIGIKLRSSRGFKRISIDPLLTSWFGLIFLLGAVGVGFDFYLDGRPVNYPAEYPFQIQTETAELLIGLGSSLYLWLNLRAFAPRMPKRIILDKIGVRGKTLELGFPGGILATMPISGFPWLAEADAPQRKNLRLTKGGSCIHWLDLGVEQQVCQLLKDGIGPAPLRGNETAPFKRVHALIPIAAGLISMLWLALIPGDPKSAVLFGLSKNRLVMLAVGLGLLGLLSGIILRAQRDPAWRKTMTDWFDQITRKTTPLTLITWAAAAVFLVSTATLIATYTHPDPSIQGILQRLAPWAAWSLITALNVFLLALPRLVAAARSQLVRISGISFYEDDLTLKMGSQREITLPIMPYPILSQASQSQKEAFFINPCGGSRVEWLALGFEIQAQGLFYKNYGEK